jgi:hypothetical protein
MCRLIDRPLSDTVWAVRSTGADPGSWASQYLSQIAAAGFAGAVGVAFEVRGVVRWALGGSAGSRVSQ